MACPESNYVDNYTPVYPPEGAPYPPFVLNDTAYSCPGGKWDECCDHNIVVTGWSSTDAGAPYWIVRNSWGTWWGEGGWFRIVMGVNMLGIESRCDWATPKLAPPAPTPPPTPQW